MPVITAYHCSPVKIDKFDLSKGCHFGGYFSSLEAALRKDGDDPLYVHKVKIDHTSLTISEDLRNDATWQELRQEMLESYVSVARYKNLDEPDYTPSYFVLDTAKVDIIEVTTISRQQAEAAINREFY